MHGVRPDNADASIQQFDASIQILENGKFRLMQHLTRGRGARISSEGQSISDGVVFDTAIVLLQSMSTRTGDSAGNPWAMEAMATMAPAMRATLRRERLRIISHRARRSSCWHR